MTNDDLRPSGVPLPNGCRITHGTAAKVSKPFDFTALTMHELDAGGIADGYAGQIGLIPFQADFRLPRHVHIREHEDEAARLVAERIIVLNGVGMTELAGEIYVVAPGSLVEIGAGVPHTWTACPSGVALPDGTVSDGTFLMIYEYSEPTRFYPIASTAPIRSAADYRPFDGNLESIRFPLLTASEVVGRAKLVWNDQPAARLRTPA